MLIPEEFRAKLEAGGPSELRDIAVWLLDRAVENDQAAQKLIEAHRAVRSCLRRDPPMVSAAGAIATAVIKGYDEAVSLQLPNAVFWGAARGMAQATGEPIDKHLVARCELEE